MASEKNMSDPAQAKCQRLGWGCPGGPAPQEAAGSRRCVRQQQRAQASPPPTAKFPELSAHEGSGREFAKAKPSMKG